MSMELRVAEAASDDARGLNRAIDRATSLAASAAASWVVVAVGVALRLIRYAADRSLWGDEAMLALNIMNKNPRELLDTLDFTQAAPPAFLLSEKVAVVTLGPSEYALRLVPLLSGVAALILFRSVARRFLQPFPALVALTLFAVAEPLVYYASEVKQYSVDVLAVLIILYLAFPILDGGKLSRTRAVGLGISGSALVWFSHPVIFALAGVGATIIVSRTVVGDRRGLVTPLLISGAWAATFSLSYLRAVTRTAEVRSALGLVGGHANTGPTHFLRDAWYAFSDPGPFAKSMTALVAALAALGIVTMLSRRPWQTSCDLCDRRCSGCRFCTRQVSVSR